MRGIHLESIYEEVRTSVKAGMALFALFIPSVAACATAADWTRADWTLPESGAVREGNVMVFDLAETGTAMATTPRWGPVTWNWRRRS